MNKDVIYRLLFSTTQEAPYQSDLELRLQYPYNRVTHGTSIKV